MTVRRLAIAALLTVAAIVGQTALADANPCAGDDPAIEVAPDEVTAGASVLVTGTDWGTCTDGEAAPLTDVRIGFVQDRSFAELATVSADDTFEFLTHVDVPADATPGPATLQVLHEQARVIVDLDVVDGPVLADTGADLRVALPAALVCLLAGMGLVAAARQRRRPRAHASLTER